METAEIIAIGSELLTPHRVDSNSLYLTRQLNSIGIEVDLKVVAGDHESRLEASGEVGGETVSAGDRHRRPGTDRRRH